MIIQSEQLLERLAARMETNHGCRMDMISGMFLEVLSACCFVFLIQQKR